MKNKIEKETIDTTRKCMIDDIIELARNSLKKKSGFIDLFLINDEKRIKKGYKSMINYNDDKKRNPFYNFRKIVKKKIINDISSSTYKLLYVLLLSDVFEDKLKKIKKPLYTKSQFYPIIRFFFDKYKDEEPKDILEATKHPYLYHPILESYYKEKDNIRVMKEISNAMGNIFSFLLYSKYDTENENLLDLYLDIQDKIFDNNPSNSEDLDNIFMQLQEKKNVNIEDYLNQINLAVDFNLGFEGDFIRLYGNKILGKELKENEEERLMAILVNMDGIKTAREEIVDYFNNQKVKNSILDISKKTKYWYKLKEEARNFISEQDYEPDLNIFDNFSNNNLEGLLEGKINVIDLGCGNGKKGVYFYKKLENKVKRLFFLDASEPMLTYASINAKKQNIVARKMNIDLEIMSPKTFEDLEEQNLYLFLGQTLGNFEKPERIIENISGVMKNNDYLIIEVDIEKDLNKYKSKWSEDFLLSYLNVVGITKNYLSNLATQEDESGGIRQYFTLNKDFKNLKKGIKLFVAESKKFDRKTLLRLFSDFDLEPTNNFLYEQKGKLIGAFSKM